jgi:transcriptional regulator with XRE-family HTH domain
MNTFGKRLEQLRKSKKLSTWDVEKQTTLQRSNLRAVELGTRPASDRMLRELATLYGVQFEMLKAWKILYYKQSSKVLACIRAELLGQ